MNATNTTADSAAKAAVSRNKSAFMLGVPIDKLILAPFRNAVSIHSHEVGRCPQRLVHDADGDELTSGAAANTAAAIVVP